MVSRLKKLLGEASFDRGLIAGFLVFTFVPMLVLVFRPCYGIEHWTDRRPIHQRPRIVWDLEQWKRLPFQCEWFVSDRICYRNKLIRTQNLIGLRAFGLAPIGTTCLKPRHSLTGTVAGKEGWLYLAGHGSLPASRCTAPFSNHDLNNWRQVHLQRQRWLRDRGVGYLLFVAPDKHTIYPEFVPESMRRRGAESRCDQLYNHLAEFAPNLQTVDLRPVLREAKTPFPCYHRTDSHWNKWGAMVAASAVLRKVEERYPGIGPIPTPADYEIEMAEGEGGDLSDTLKVKPYYSDLQLEVTLRSSQEWSELPKSADEPHTWKTAQADPSKPRVVFISDSFGWSMAPHFPPCCSRFSWYLQIYEDVFPYEFIERESPDLVIFEHVERKLNHLDPGLANPPALLAPPNRLALFDIPAIH